MRAVQNAHLTLLVGGDIGHHDAVDTGLLEGQLLLQPCGTFDVPHAEDLAHIGQRVGIAVGLVKAGNLSGIADAAGHDAVNQSGAEGALLVDVCLEFGFQTPLVNVLIDALQQLLAVVVDELTGQDHQTALTGLPTLIQHLSQLAGEGGGGLVSQLAGGVL